MQIEGIGLVNGATNVTLAKSYIDFALSLEMQNLLALNNWMFPVNTEVPLPPSYDYAIMDVESHNILEAILLYGVVDKKVFFANADGFGAIDLITNTIDFFSSIGSLVSLSTIISSEYVEVVDEV